MPLQYALLLIGVIIVAIVALTAMDRARVTRLFRRNAPAPRPEHLEPTVLVPGHEPYATLDINPAPPHETEKKFLAPDAPVTPRVHTPHEAFHTEIETLHEVATMQLDLGPDLDHARRGGPAGDPASPRQPDDKIDFILLLPGKGPVPRNLALGIFKQHEYLLEKPHYLFGQRCKDGKWTELGRDPAKVTYDDLMLSIQMVDDSGPINESELNTFAQLGLKLADALHRPTKFSLGFENALACARQLQAFCDAFDVIAGVNVVANGPIQFNGRAIEQAARKFGMQFGAMNIFHMKNEVSPGCRHLFSLANLFQPGEFDPEQWDSTLTSGLTLFMSVPCAHHPVAVFEKMIATAKGLCERLDGHLLDQERRPLTDQGIDVIRGQIVEIEEKMRAHGIVPGSESALRLFRVMVAPAQPVAA
jgi:hypothetical protein